MVELKPCPFCGSHADGVIITYETGEQTYYVTCSECSNAQTDDYDDQQDAVRAWNTRH